MDSTERRRKKRPDPRIWTEAERTAHRQGKMAWAESPVQMPKKTEASQDAR